MRCASSMIGASILPACLMRWASRSRSPRRRSGRPGRGRGGSQLPRMDIRDHSGGSQLPPEYGADRNRAASCLEAMPRSETRAASCLGAIPRSELGAASCLISMSRTEPRAAGCLEAMPRSESKQLAATIRARGPRRRNRLPSTRSSERATKQPDATWRSSPSAWRKTAAGQPSQRATSMHADGSARKRRSRARAARCDRAAFTLRQALTQPKNRGRCRMAAMLAPFLGARVARSRGAARARTSHTSQGGPDVEQRCLHQSQLPRRPSVDGRRTRRALDGRPSSNQPRYPGRGDGDDRRVAEDLRAPHRGPGRAAEFDLAKVDKLLTYARAMTFAHTLYLGASGPSELLPQLVE